ncbi:DNA sulfur modification protein DndB [Paenibacillus sp. Soil766]|uniref:DNA sulfur modification protein DndB n=1 Tax=Paenibacillus sp. Soil766 TaxID=1736404 RepID=UPI00070E0D54|nr:DNA sulfur modification protein DndB [Paenibacillus sp. Soil766]KRF01084.1 DNA sulfur modification protein DndB [Paenibacillus sp. Soil766]
MNASFSYNFPAIRGLQAGDQYFVVMCPLKLIPRIFLFDEEEIPPEHRAQRSLNKARVPDICNYILNNSKDYVFSSLTASVDGEMVFTPFSEEAQFKDIGKLAISLDARFLINDGQHRRAAIEEALKIAPELGNETISVVFFQDTGLVKSQQIFADLNRHAVNTTSSLGILYEHRDQLASITKTIISRIPLLERYTDLEKQSLSKLSPKLFALSNIFQTNSRLLNKKRGELITDSEKQFLEEFWRELCNAMVEWQLVMKKELSPTELRKNFINAHGIFLEAIGIVGHYVHNNQPTDWNNYIQMLSAIDWNRSNKVWFGRAFGTTGRINKNNETIQLTANMIKSCIELPLTEQESILEQKAKIG